MDYSIPICKLIQEIKAAKVKICKPDVKEFIHQCVCKQFSIPKSELDELCATDLELSISSFAIQLVKKYRSYNRMFSRLLRDNWCTGILCLPSSVVSLIVSHSALVPTSTPKSFSEKSKRSQYRETKKLRDSFEPETIFKAAAQNLSQAGRKDAQFVIKKVNSATGLTAAKARAAITSQHDWRPTKINSLEALAFIVDHNLTKVTYEAMSATSAAHNASIWPSYRKVGEAKLACRPDETDFSEHCAVVPLQSLLDHTLKRILESDRKIKDQLCQVAEEQRRDLHASLYFKYGFDGSGSHDRPMQRDSQGEVPKIKSLVLSQLVVLQLDANIDEEEVVFYTCPMPNNPHFCRPIRVCFESESSTAILTEHQRLRTEVEQLEEYVVSEAPKVTVTYKGLETMVDGKVVSAVTNRNTSCCPICDKGSSEMAKNIGPFDPVSEERLSFGASPLHFSLRTFEALLHIGYKQDIKKFQVRNNPDATAKLNKKTQEVKKEFEREFGLIVDQRRPGGFGNTNTGNVARKAFANADKFARICGVSTHLVSNLDVISRTLASGLSIDADKFGDFCDETLAEYMDSCGWYNIPPTLHKILVHGKDIIKATPLPIGRTSEEGSESNTKFCRKYYKHHTRKVSSGEALEDLFNRLMDVSDPVV